MNRRLLARHPQPALERLAFTDGAALRSRDLDDLDAYETRLLGLHVRGLHDTAGVAEGLGLSIAPNGRSVTVTAGAAFTNCGEVIALHRPVTIAGPRRAIPGAARSRFILALGAPTPESTSPCERPAQCTGALPSPRVPTLRWVPATITDDTTAQALRPREEIPLGAVIRRADGLIESIDYADRRAARPMSRPHIGFGTLKAGSLLWTPSVFPLRARIDTRAAGFSATPAYLVTVGSITGLPASIVGPFVSVEQPSATGFTLRLLFADRPARPALTIANLVTERLANVEIRWMGLEAARGCSPMGGMA